MRKIVTRTYPVEAYGALAASGIDPVLARIYASRGIISPEEINCDLNDLIPFDALKNAAKMGEILADAIRDKMRLLIVADYDSDGATACAVGMLALSEMGAIVDYLVPNRFEYGYGLTPEIVRLAKTGNPDLIITVDNGIASVEGVLEAKRLGIPVLVTDHHLPGEALPEALCIVNPNQPGCPFPSKNLAGVGVMFYVMLALRAELRKRGNAVPNLSALLDLVALGTVADVVRLDRNNRILVSQGLKRIREDRANPGILALFSVAKRAPKKASSFDLGFMLGPRLNAAGRLEDMALGISCLISRDLPHARGIAERLDELNRERKSIESQMQEEALLALESIQNDPGYSISLFDPTWHQGVIGILASRIREKFHRPSFAFARSGNGEIKGSGRSIPGLHLRDALDLVSKLHSGLILKFGGHAQAAGLTLREADFEAFDQAFEEVAKNLLSESDLERIIETEGILDKHEMTLELARRIEPRVWGQGFPEPEFEGQFSVEQQRIVGEKHLKLKLGLAGKFFDAMLFFHAAPLPEKIRAIYNLSVNEFNGSANLQLTIRHWFPVPQEGVDPSCAASQQ
ncbi:MAG: single-stranded-DNA-specific exonuclease RecJ [Burkholderiales bacterium]